MSRQAGQPEPAETPPTTAPPALTSDAERATKPPPPPGAVLGSMRIRKKLIVLHTLFSLALAFVLLVTLRPAITEVVERAEIDEARLLLRLIQRQAGSEGLSSAAVEALGSPSGVSRLRAGSAAELGLSDATVQLARSQPRSAVPAYLNAREPAAVMAIQDDRFLAATVRIEASRAAVWKLYAFVTAALLAVYLLVAAALEIFVLPKNVYAPIARVLDADAAARAGDAEREIIPTDLIPADELGEIMASRNRTILALRSKERQLSDALAQLELAANDLQRKNHLLQTAQRNLADADRLASLGMMSAGIAHELNTPLAVIKGLAERLLNHRDHALPADQAALLHRVVGRLERLSESLLDFARARPPTRSLAHVREIVDEALTLVRLDREAGGVAIENHVDPAQTLACDADRMIQVMVNLIRNAVDALAAPTRSRAAPPRIEVEAKVAPAPSSQASTTRHDQPPTDWLTITIRDNGPGIDPDVLPRLFEPFASTRLDSNGTGLGLAVAQGIVHEHGGLILARNRSDSGGAIFEVLVPMEVLPAPTLPVPRSTSTASLGQDH